MTSPHGFGNTPPQTPALPSVPVPEIPGLAQITDLGQALGAVKRWISDRHNWVRVGWFVGGVVLMVGGVAVMAGKPAVQSTIKTVGKVL